MLGLPCKRKGVAGGQRPPRWPGGADGVPPPAVSVVGYGNASGGHNSPISRPGGGGAPIKGLYVFLDRHYGSQPGVCTLQIDEFRSTVVDSACLKMEAKDYHVPGTDQKYGLK